MKKTVAALALVALLSLGACGGASINWDDRIGEYTYEQAVEDYGEPESSQELDYGDVMYFWYGSGQSGWENRTVLVFDATGKLALVEKADD